MAGEDKSGSEVGHRPVGFVITGRIMVIAVSILFTVIAVVVFLHVYARCCLIRHRRHQPRRVRRRVARLRLHVLAFSDGSNVVQSAPVPAHERGLDEAALRSLPVVIFSSSEAGAGGEKGMECAVCLNEFEENEKGRLLPNCKHCFHTDCIDMWFHSHSTCPLCRAPVFEHNAVLSETTAAAAAAAEMAVISLDMPTNENGDRDSCRTSENEAGSSSLSSSPTSCSSSSGGGFMSLKRIVSREGMLSPRGLRRSSAVENDIERGCDEPDPPTKSGAQV